MKKGFTLIEIIVIVGALSLIMISLTSILSGVFNSQSKNISAIYSDLAETILPQLRRSRLIANVEIKRERRN